MVSRASTPAMSRKTRCACAACGATASIKRSSASACAAVHGPRAARSSRSAVIVLLSTGVGVMRSKLEKSSLPAHNPALEPTQSPSALLQAQDVCHDVPEIVVGDDD